MKRLFVFLMITTLITGMVSAQAIRDQQRAPDSQANEQLRDLSQVINRERNNNSIAIEGTLKLENGFVAVESAGNVYYVPMLNRYIGFITGLKEGAKVSLEGREFRNMVQPTKVTIDGKSYDFMARNSGQRYERQNYQHRDNNRRYAPNSRWNNRGYRNRSGRGCCW